MACRCGAIDTTQRAGERVPILASIGDQLVIDLNCPGCRQCACVVKRDSRRRRADCLRQLRRGAAGDRRRRYRCRCAACRRCPTYGCPRWREGRSSDRSRACRCCRPRCCRRPTRRCIRRSWRGNAYADTASAPVGIVAVGGVEARETVEVTAHAEPPSRSTQRTGALAIIQAGESLVASADAHLLGPNTRDTARAIGRHVAALGGVRATATGTQRAGCAAYRRRQARPCGTIAGETVISATITDTLRNDAYSRGCAIVVAIARKSITWAQRAQEHSIGRWRGRLCPSSAECHYAQQYAERQRDDVSLGQCSRHRLSRLEVLFHSSASLVNKKSFLIWSSSGHR